MSEPEELYGVAPVDPEAFAAALAAWGVSSDQLDELPDGRACLFCGGSLGRKRSLARYCSNAHRQAAYRARLEA